MTMPRFPYTTLFRSSTKTCAGWQRLGTGKRRPRDGQPSARPRPPRDLLDLDRSAGLFQLLLDLLGLLPGDALLDRLGGAVHQVLGLLEAQARDLPDDLDDLDLLGTGVGQDDVELGLLLGLGLS